MKDDKAELIPIKFADSNYVIAISLNAKDLSTGKRNNSVPPEVGFVVPW